MRVDPTNNGNTYRGVSGDVRFVICFPSACLVSNVCLATRPRAPSGRSTGPLSLIPRRINWHLTLCARPTLSPTPELAPTGKEDLDRYLPTRAHNEKQTLLVFWCPDSPVE